MKLIRVLGSPHSGRSIVRAVLNTHPAIYAVGSLGTLLSKSKSGLTTKCSCGTSGCLFSVSSDFDSKDIHTVVFEALNSQHPESEALVDTTPLDASPWFLDDTCFVHIIKQPEMAIASIVRNTFKGKKPKHTELLVHIENWITYYESNLKRLAQYNYPVYPISYAQLIASPSARNLLLFEVSDFINIEPENRIFDFDNAHDTKYVFHNLTPCAFSKPLRPITSMQWHYDWLVVKTYTDGPLSNQYKRMVKVYDSVMSYTRGFHA